MGFVARWTPLGSWWTLTVEGKGGAIVRYRRTDVPACHEMPGDEHLAELGFGALPGAGWMPEPGGRRMAVEPVPCDAAGAEHDPGPAGS